MTATTETETEIDKARLAAIQELRLDFERHGFDVSAYGDTDVSHAVLEAATPGTHSCRELFGRAFERLRQPRGRRMSHPT